MTEICHFCATDVWEIQIPTQKMATRRKNRRSEEKTEALKRKTENRRQDKYLQRRFYQLRAIVSVVNIQSIQSVCKCYVFSRTQIALCCFSMKTIHCHSSMDWKAQKWVLHSNPLFELKHHEKQRNEETPSKGQSPNCLPHESWWSPSDCMKTRAYVQLQGNSYKSTPNGRPHQEPDYCRWS